MTFWRRFWLSIGSGVFPGLGDGLLVRHRRMLAWALGSLAAPLLALWSARLLWIAVALHLACIVVTFLTIPRPGVEPAPATPAPPEAVVAGHVPESHRPRRSRPLAITAIVIGLIGGGLVELSLETVRLPSSSMAPTLQIGDHIVVDKLTYRLRAPRRDDLILFAHPCDGRRFLKRVVATAGQTVEVRCGDLYIDGARVASRLVSAACTYEDHLDGEILRRSCSEYEERGHRIFHAAAHPSNRRGELHDFPRALEHGPPSCAANGAEPVVAQQEGHLVQTATNLDLDRCAPQLHYVVPGGHVFVLGDNRDNSNDSRYWGAVPLASVIGRGVGVYWNH